MCALCRAAPRLPPPAARRRSDSPLRLPTPARLRLLPAPQGPSFVPAKVFLGGVSNDTNDESLRAYCGQWGEIADVHVFSGKGYAFVTFAAVPTAQAFLEVRRWGGGGAGQLMICSCLPHQAGLR